MPQTRRNFLKTSAALAAAELSARSERPNVLFIISDQLHHAAMGAAGNPVIKTPNLDRLAAEGSRFENAVCVTPFCSPTRASFLTGVYPHSHGITQNVDGSREGLDPRLPTTEQVLNDAGYTCRQFGKWHLGDRKRLPPYRDQPRSGYRDSEDRARGEYSEAMGRNDLPVFVTEAVRRANKKAGGQNTVIGRIDQAPEKTRESLITNEALAEIDRLADSTKPFFLTVSLPAPHAPWEIGEPYYSLHPRSRIVLPANRNSAEPADKAAHSWLFGQALGQALGEDGMREYLGVYYGLVSMMDWNVGRLLDALRRRGIEDNTLVVFTADHGDMQGGHGCYDKTVVTMYEEIVRVPLILRWPKRVPAGKVVRTEAGSCDISPTILDYMGNKPGRAIHGTSLRPYADGKEDPNRPIFCERGRGQGNFQRMIRTVDWKYIYASSGASQLYCLEKDPGETKNLIGDPAARSAEKQMQARLAEWMRATGDERTLPFA